MFIYIFIVYVVPMVLHTTHYIGNKVFVPGLLWHRAMIKRYEIHTAIECIECNQERYCAEQGYFSPQVTYARIHSLFCRTSMQSFKLYILLLDLLIPTICSAIHHI